MEVIVRSAFVEKEKLEEFFGVWHRFIEQHLGGDIILLFEGETGILDRPSKSKLVIDFDKNRVFIAPIKVHIFLQKIVVKKANFHPQGEVVLMFGFFREQKSFLALIAFLVSQ